eukprot:2849619-Amphidinium_carterae.1
MGVCCDGISYSMVMRVCALRKAASAQHIKGLLLPTRASVIGGSALVDKDRDGSMATTAQMPPEGIPTKTKVVRATFVLLLSNLFRLCGVRLFKCFSCKDVVLRPYPNDVVAATNLEYIQWEVDDLNRVVDAP